MVTLYSMYPVKLVTWAQTLDGAAPTGQFVLKYGSILKLHAALLQPASACCVSFQFVLARSFYIRCSQSACTFQF